jgi:hypothetical protein
VPEFSLVWIFSFDAAPANTSILGTRSPDHHSLSPIQKYRRYVRLIVSSPRLWCNRFVATDEVRERAMVGVSNYSDAGPAIQLAKRIAR